VYTLGAAHATICGGHLNFLGTFLAQRCELTVMAAVEVSLSPLAMVTIAKFFFFVLKSLNLY
jgi:hypothetical protein